MTLVGRRALAGLPPRASSPAKAASAKASGPRSTSASAAATIPGGWPRTAPAALRRSASPPTRLAVASQVHGIAVRRGRRALAGSQAPDADAVVSRRPGIAAGRRSPPTAPRSSSPMPRPASIGAAHAGWRGALDGVIEATVGGDGPARRPDRIAAAIGPCIARESYEVGPEFRDRFIAADREQPAFSRPSPASDRLLFDLKAFCRLRLERAGVSRIDVLPRRHLRRRASASSASAGRPSGRKARFGLQLSAIGLP